MGTTTHLRDTLAAIDATPSKRTTGAYFDVDGAVIAGQLGQVFAAEQLRRRAVGIGDVPRLVRRRAARPNPTT